MRYVALAVGVLLAACTTSPVIAPATAAPSTTPAGAAIRVLVTAPGGSPVPGARVCASTARTGDRCADATAGGTVEMTLPRALTFVRVEGPAAGPRYGPQQRVVDLTRGDAALWVEIPLQHRIGGTIRDEAGRPVARAQACAHPASDDPPTCERSGADGAYAIDVNAGVYRVEVSGPPGGKLVGQWAVDRAFPEEAGVYDARAADVAGVDVVLAAGVVLRGTITFEGKPVEDAQVCVKTLAAPLPWDCGRTDRKGGYSSLQVPGRYWVWAIPPDDLRAVAVWAGDVLTGVETHPVSLTADSTLDLAFAGPPDLAVLTGFVRTPTGSAVSGALVCVDTPFPTGRICRSTSGLGRYVIATRPETYVVSVTPPAHSGYITEYYEHARTWIDAQAVTVDAGESMLDLVLRPGTIVRGIVRTRSGIPMAGSTLNFSDASGVVAAVDTDIAGRFEATMPHGHYRVEVFPSLALAGSLVEGVTETDAPRNDDLVIVLDDVSPAP